MKCYKTDFKYSLYLALFLFSYLVEFLLILVRIHFIRPTKWSSISSNGTDKVVVYSM